MADKNDRVQGDGRVSPTGRPDILRAKDIIPGGAGAPRSTGENKDAGGADIPQFDLANDIMAQQRRLTAIRRKAPASPLPGFVAPAAPLVFQRAIEDQQETLFAEWDPIIAEIVTRDIELFCCDYRR